MSIATVYPLLRLPCDKGAFSYHVPDAMHARIGQIAQMPFRKKKIFGLIVSLRPGADDAEQALSPITSVLHEQPFLTENEIQSALQLSAFYHVYPGLILKKMCPPLQPRALTKAHIRIPNNEVKTDDSHVPQYIWFNDPQQCDEILPILERSLGKPILHLLPSEQLVEQVQKKLQKAFPAVSMYASLPKTKTSANRALWLRMRNAEPVWVFATRHGSFLPLTPGSAVVLWYSHDQHHKNWDAIPYYHSADVLRIRGRHETFSFFEATHTATLEHVTALQQQTAKEIGKWHPKPVPVESIDMYNEYRNKNFSGISEQAHRQLLQTDPRAQCLVLHNKKGYAEEALCRDCEEALAPQATACMRCGSTRIRYCAKGIEAVRADIASRFPQKKLELCTAETSNASLSEADCIVATDAAFSKIDFATIACIWIPYADRFLSRPWYSSVEDGIAFFRDLYARIRGNTPIIAHTWQPEHLFWKSLADISALRKLYAHEQKARETHAFPPYTYLIRVLSPETEPLPKVKNHDTTYTSKLIKVPAAQWLERTTEISSAANSTTRIDPRPLPF